MQLNAICVQSEYNFTKSDERFTKESTLLQKVTTKLRNSNPTAFKWALNSKFLSSIGFKLISNNLFFYNIFWILLEFNLNSFGLRFRNFVVTFCKIVLSFVNLLSFFVKLCSIEYSSMQFAYNLSTAEYNFTKSDKRFTKESTILQKVTKKLRNLIPNEL